MATTASIEAAFEQLRQQLLAVRHARVIVISVCDLHTKRELTDSVVLSLNIEQSAIMNTSDSFSPSFVPLDTVLVLSQEQHHNIPVHLSPNPLASAVNEDDNSNAAEFTTDDDDNDHNDVNANDRESLDSDPTSMSMSTLKRITRSRYCFHCSITCAAYTLVLT